MVPVRSLGVLFSEMERVMFASPEPVVDDRVIHEASFEAVQLSFDVIEILFEMDADVTEMLEGETVGASMLAPFCVTEMVLLSEPEVRFVSETVIDPVRFEVLVLVDAFTLMVLPLVVTVIQLASFVVVNVPSVLTEILSEPPEASKVRLSGDTVRYLPSWVTVTLAEPALFWTVIVPVLLLVVLFSEMETVTFALLEPEVDDNVIQDASLVEVQSAFEVIEMLLDVASDETEMFDGLTVGASTEEPFCVTEIVLLSEPEVRFVSDTVTVPVRFEILVLAEVFTVMALPLVVTVIQLASFEVVNEPSVLTVTFSEPPEASKDRLSGETVRYFPSCVTITLAVPATF